MAAVKHTPAAEDVKQESGGAVETNLKVALAEPRH